MIFSFSWLGPRPIAHISRRAKSCLVHFYIEFMLGYFEPCSAIICNNLQQFAIICNNLQCNAHTYNDRVKSFLVCFYIEFMLNYFDLCVATICICLQYIAHLWRLGEIFPGALLYQVHAGLFQALFCNILQYIAHIQRSGEIFPGALLYWVHAGTTLCMAAPRENNAWQSDDVHIQFWWWWLSCLW